jgi:hypothetical protein
MRRAGRLDDAAREAALLRQRFPDASPPPATPD